MKLNTFFLLHLQFCIILALKCPHCFKNLIDGEKKSKKTSKRWSKHSNFKHILWLPFSCFVYVCLLSVLWVRGRIWVQASWQYYALCPLVHTKSEFPNVLWLHVWSRLREGNVIFNYRYYQNKLQRTEGNGDYFFPFLCGWYVWFFVSSSCWS